ncbi:hypothetical protein ACFQT0_10955 [Hymenobacter humi]|uniref:Uncharacterized protein n=1 Tax=Hymenobacter humi TaxID=1411620 RepID=A0ABW2U4Q5_9BACT
MKTSFFFRLAQFRPQATAAFHSLAHARALRPLALGLLAVAGTAFTSPASPETTEPVYVTQPDAESLRVRINNATKKPAYLRVLQLDNNRWLLNETHREPAYGTLLKFNNLPSGRYAVILRVGPDRYRYNVQVETKAPGATTIAVRETTSRRVENGLATAAL